MNIRTGIDNQHILIVPGFAYLHDGVHGADGDEVALGVLARLVAEPLQGEGERRQQDVVVHVQRLLHVVVH